MELAQKYVELRGVFMLSFIVRKSNYSPQEALRRKLCCEQRDSECGLLSRCIWLNLLSHGN